jgi:UDP-N-acetylglucosamine 2-epimerase (non-hydrolysing)
MKKISFIFGTRPELIKVAPLIKAFQKEADIFNLNLISTGQHKELLNNLYKWFDFEANINLEIMQFNQSPSQVIANILQKLDLAIKDSDLIIVQGDTATAYSGAMAGFLHKIPIAHLEAGLRTDNIYNPFPEEMLRRQISQISTLNFPPTERAKENLKRENIQENVFVVGNTVIDSLKDTINKLEKLEEHNQLNEFINLPFELNELNQNKKLVLITMHRRESLGEEHKQVAKALKRVSQEHKDLLLIFPIHPNPAVRESIEPILKDCPNIKLIEPLDYITFCFVLKKAYILITDSGGLQEEGCSLGKPTLILRKTTERPEAIEAGNAKLIGTNEENVYANFTALLKDINLYNQMSKPSNIFGTGNSAELIINKIKAFLY